MTDKSVLERLREDLAKRCSAIKQKHNDFAEQGSDVAHSWAGGASECEQAIRAHDLSSYESAPRVHKILPEQGATEAAAPASGACGAADPDVAGLIERLNEAANITQIVITDKGEMTYSIVLTGVSRELIKEAAAALKLVYESWPK